MNARLLLVRAPLLAVLAVVLTLLVLRSSLAKLLPFDATTFPAPLWIGAAILLALTPALLARQTPLPAAGAIAVPLLAASAYGASRLDWLRVLKDFEVAENALVSPPRLALGVAAILLLWALHTADLAHRLRTRAVARGIEPLQAGAAARRSLLRNAQAGGIAIAGAAGLLGVSVLGLQVAGALPTQRAALVAPIVAAAVLVVAALALARSRSA